MLDSINISHIFVSDQDKAVDFYVGKLGLEVTSDLRRVWRRHGRSRPRARR